MLGTLVVVGGEVHLPSLRRIAAQKIFLFEARRDVFLRLKRDLYDDRITVTHAIPNLFGRNEELVRFNVPMHDSPLAPSGLLSLYQNLLETGRETVPGLSFQEMAVMLEFSSDHPNRLIIDVPGAELNILRGLNDEGLLADFDCVTVQTSRSTLYTNGSDLQSCIAWCDTALDQKSIRQSDADPERPILSIYPNKEAENLSSRVREISAELSTALKELDITKEKLRDEASRLEKMQKESADLQSKNREFAKKLENTESYAKRLAEDLRRARRDAELLIGTNEVFRGGQEELIKLRGQVEILRDFLASTRR
ncbi:hypothetical protein LOS8367_03684 [Limimaricola soesokkakensis]|uniref:Uncharacterized protein n=2 Tax=Limimaricola soesokkakensis TaxID=1343159 RepID=A0A1X7A705_9RHOB|nr:hypothetical protein LOS8367_03684 [Limimaricola soesokkakensis]